MKLPTKEAFINEKLIARLMEARGCGRDQAVAHLEDKYRRREEAAGSGASDEEIAKAGMPLTFGEIFMLMFADDLRESCSK